MVAKILRRLRTIPCVLHERLHFRIVVIGDKPIVESVESRAESLTLGQNRVPTQPGLETLQNKQLEQSPIVMDRPPPFLVVIGAIKGIPFAPTTSFRCHHLIASNCFVPVSSRLTETPHIIRLANGAAPLRGRAIIVALVSIKEVGRRTYTAHSGNLRDRQIGVPKQ